MALTDWPREPLTAETMLILDRVLRDWCVQEDCEIESEMATLTAKSLVDWFEFGVRDEGELARVIRDQISL